MFRPPQGGGAYFGQAYRYEQVQHYRYWAYVAVKAWINAIAGGEPPHLGKITQAEARQKRVKRKALGGPQEHEEFEPYPHNHPLVKLFRNPNGPDVAFDLWAYHILFKKLTGISYWWVVRNDFFVPVEIWVIPTHWVRLMPERDGQPGHYFVQSPWGYGMKIPYEEVVTFFEHSPLNPRYEGYGPSQGCPEWIDLYESMTRMRLAVFKNGAVPSLHVALGESYSDPDDAFLNRFYAKWYSRFLGENNSGRPLITGPDIEVKGIDGHRPADAVAATIQTEEQIRDIVLSAFQVPKGIVGLEPVSDTSAYAPGRIFAHYAVNPELTYTSQVISEKIVKTTPGHEDGVCFWDNRVIDEVEKTRAEERQDLDTGVRTINEIRTTKGMAPYPMGGDNPMINGQELPFVKADQQSSEFAKEFQKALGEGSGASGGYLVPAERYEIEDKSYSLSDAGKWLADKWQQLEGRYGRKGALAMALASVVTFPIPGNLAAVVAAAEAIRGLRS